MTLLNRGLSEKAKTALQASNEARKRTELLFELILSTRKFDTISVRECHRICNELAEVGIDLHLHRDRDRQVKVRMVELLDVCQWVGGESLGLGGGRALHRNDNCRLKHPSPPHLREANQNDPRTFL